MKKCDIRIIHRTNYLSRAEIRWHIKKLLGVHKCPKRLIDKVKSNDVFFSIDSLEAFTEFCDRVPPCGWKHPSFSWDTEGMRVWVLLNLESLTQWLLD